MSVYLQPFTAKMSDNKKVVQESVKKIRIILVSRNVKAIEEGMLLPLPLSDICSL